VPEVVEGTPGKIVIAGGGIAGLEALMALHDLAGERAEVTLVAPQPEFVYRPWLVEEPFSAKPAERRALEPLAAEFGASFVQQPLARVRPGDCVAELGDGTELPYDAALACIGARPVAPFEGVHTLTLGPEPLPMNDLLSAAADHPSARMALVVPAGVSWALPIYEVAMLAQRRAQELGLEVELEVITPESAPLIVFGRVPSDAVAALLDGRGIGVRSGVRAVAYEDGEVQLKPETEGVAAGAVVALPQLEGPAIDGLPADEDGFIPIDEHARVQGTDGVYAAGDGTNFPIKQGGIGTQEADAAAQHIAAGLGAEVQPEPFHPILRGKLLVGEESLNLAADVAGGGGEGAASPDYLWWPPQKVGGRYLAPYLEGEEAHLGLEPPRHPLDVEVALPKEWHREPMAIDAYGPSEHE
jgi:sulfide:quinone oxidoreductase